MSSAWHILRRITLLLVGVVCLQMNLHSAVCHGDSAPVEHSESGADCSCECHTPAGPAVRTEYRASPSRALLPFGYMATCGVIVPPDIFRPPLANR